MGAGFRKARRLAAAAFSIIGSKIADDKWADAAAEGEVMCSEFDYEGGEPLLMELLEEGDFWDEEPDMFTTIRQRIEGVHDPVSTWFYDHGCDMDKWDEAWQHVLDAVTAKEGSAVVAQ